LDYLARIGLQRDLRKRQMGVRTGQVVGSASIGSLTLADVYTDEPTVLSAPGLCVWAGPRMAVDDLWRERLLSEPGLSIPVGDAYAPRDILSAVHEGHRRGEVL